MTGERWPYAGYRNPQVCGITWDWVNMGDNRPTERGGLPWYDMEGFYGGKGQ